MMSKKATIAWESWNAIVDEILNEDPVSILEAQLTEEEIESGKWYSWDESAYQADNTKGWGLNE